VVRVDMVAAWQTGSHYSDASRSRRPCGEVLRLLGCKLPNYATELGVSSDAVLGMHGAALAHAIFSPKGVYVFEL
jgi:uncharacterized membrane protein YeaQ/YmgE (transglycosylase-associated protein family)